VPASLVSRSSAVPHTPELAPFDQTLLRVPSFCSHTAITLPCASAATLKSVASLALLVSMSAGGPQAPPVNRVDQRLTRTPSVCPKIAVTVPPALAASFTPETVWVADSINVGVPQLPLAPFTVKRFAHALYRVPSNWRHTAVTLPAASTASWGLCTSPRFSASMSSGGLQPVAG
jgi:hypothetical protein